MESGDLFTSGQEGYHTYRNPDHGRTWLPRQIVVADGERTCGNPCPVVDADGGTVALAFCRDNQQRARARSCCRILPIRTSGRS